MSKAGTPFKMKGSPFKRNFGIGASPMKKGLWETLTGKKFAETKFAKETKLGKDIASAGEQIEADIKRVGEIVKTGKATTPRKVAPRTTKGPSTVRERKLERDKLRKERRKKLRREKREGTDGPKGNGPKGKIDWSKAPKLNTQARRDWYTKHNLKQDATTKLE